MIKTKIIATIGPASFKKSIIRKVIISGADIIRFNFSHASRKDTLESLKNIRNINRDLRRSIKKLADLKGNRIRVKGLKKDLTLKKRDIVIISRFTSKDKSDIYFDYNGSFLPVKAGHKIFIEDGKIELEAISISENKIKAITSIGGIIKNGKGVNFPQSKLNFPSLNGEDKKDLIFACKNGFEYIAQSFVRNCADILSIREIANKMKSKARIIAKIENIEGIENIDEILKVSDGIMVARGDLGISLPFYKVPVIQKELLDKARSYGKLSIVATQMLESMTENYRPTRAEVSDVANAVFDGTNYVMLSEETATGKYPSEAVKAMNDILKYCEPWLDIYGRRKI